MDCTVFDFAFTLCSDLFFKDLPTKVREQVSTLVFHENSETWADPWMRGDLTSSDICEYLAQHLDYSTDDLLAILKDGCSDMQFNHAVWDYAKQLKADGHKTALVTLNMDVFSEVIAPSRNLEDVFDTIVNSADHHELDKAILWQIAFDSIGDGVGFENSLSIDDNVEGVKLFEQLGGQAYQYVDDEAFVEWLEHASNPEP